MVGSCYVYILRFNIATVTGCRIMYLPRIMATIGLFSTASQFMAIRNVARQGPAHALPPESQQASATIHVGQEAISEAEQATEASNLTAFVITHSQSKCGLNNTIRGRTRRSWGCDFQSDDTKPSELPGDVRGTSKGHMGRITDRET
jgi:hypothetical protein